ncbi:YaaA family protein [Candidatus Sulfurimonas baltica]|uniref:YaaA family protein n=1 Tax=Candidatus Sulfurimonas baltica TaxID=2740404 RepID=A0A7S7LUL7_9BACT|nr:YaaA family protein [Candidatus Sulfurimonas baltica]QOY51698.1 YaaA family protein [Candidatus Sulfurimonas baltica]
MKILFSPAETKKVGGIKGNIESECFLFPKLFGFRKEVLDRYQGYVSSVTDEQLSKFFGIKDSAKFEKYKTDIYSQPLMKVIERYDGVAFDYLEYSSLDDAAKQYIDQNTVIFSNLFGPMLAGDFGLPEYKLKQGEKIGDFAPEVFYKKHFSESLDEMLSDEVYLDLRAGFYNKFYKPRTQYVTLKFLKDDKVVSHWAKAYRGLVLKEMAQNKIQSIDEFMKMEIENLSVQEILKKGIHTEIVFNITN